MVSSFQTIHQSVAEKYVVNRIIPYALFLTVIFLSARKSILELFSIHSVTEATSEVQSQPIAIVGFIAVSGFALVLLIKSIADLIVILRAKSRSTVKTKIIKKSIEKYPSKYQPFFVYSITTDQFKKNLSVPKEMYSYLDIEDEVEIELNTSTLDVFSIRVLRSNQTHEEKMVEGQSQTEREMQTADYAVASKAFFAIFFGGLILILLQPFFPLAFSSLINFLKYFLMSFGVEF